MAVLLREVIDTDLPLFYEQQLDPDAIHMAAFTTPDPTDRAAFAAHWKRIRGDATITNRTILYGDAVAGYVAQFIQFGEPEVSYWIGREFWGKGIATAALAQFLEIIPVRPLYGRAAKDNRASRRVLEKCGFVVIREEWGYAYARGEEIEEVVLELREPS